MGRCYRIACEDYLDLEAFQELVQKHLGGQARLCLSLREGECGGRYYIEGQSTRGVEVYKEGDFLVVRIPLLADYADFFLGKLFLDIFCQFLGEQVLDQEGGRLDVREYFSDETVQQLRDFPGDAQEYERQHHPGLPCLRRGLRPGGGGALRPVPAGPRRAHPAAHLPHRGDSVGRQRGGARREIGRGRGSGELIRFWSSWVRPFSAEKGMNILARLSRGILPRSEGWGQGVSTMS